MSTRGDQDSSQEHTRCGSYVCEMPDSHQKEKETKEEDKETEHRQ